MMQQQLMRKDAKEITQKHRSSPYFREHTQTGHGRMFELLADLTDEDGALTEMEDIESLDD
jgi:hypothetical protein